MSFLVIGDRALADELARALAPLGEGVRFEVSFSDAALSPAPNAVVLSESTSSAAAEAVAAAVARAGAADVPVWLVAPQAVDDRGGRSFTVLSRAALVPAARSLIGASDKHRVPVQILARWRRGDDEQEAPKRLANVIGLSDSTLAVEIDEPLSEGESVELSFIIPGTSSRVQVGGRAMHWIDEGRALRRIDVERLDQEGRDALRAFLHRRLARTAG